MTASAATTANWDRTTATFDAATVAMLLGVSVSTVRRRTLKGEFASCLIWKTPNRARYTATGIARELEARTGTRVVPGRTAAFGDTEADTLEAFAIRLSIHAPLRADRAMLDFQGLPTLGLYDPKEDEYEYHLAQLTAETNKAGLI